MRVGLVQYSPVWENPEGTAEKLLSLLGGAEAVEVLVFPEMSLTGFTMESECYAEEESGAGTCFFADLARRYDTHIIAGLIERQEKAIYNSLVLFGKDGAIIARYRKIHLFSLVSENEFFSAGKDLATAQIGGEIFGFSICYDLRFPELYRRYALRGATVMVDIANWPSKRIEHWLCLLRARAIENQCYMVGVNRIGTDPTNIYNGCSAVYDPMGNEVVCARGEEKVIVVDLNVERIGQARKQMPVFGDIKLI